MRGVLQLHKKQHLQPTKKRQKRNGPGGARTLDFRIGFLLQEILVRCANQLHHGTARIGGIRA